ncbi:hypothetical protein [Flavobacterium daemonense]|uniref:hypothetical protein n=1 Tax=Flavobacterium daemonense TaxID=1393049 RepID=UPI001185C6C9|nr:hypothetical protein [Flavobacterium daemonense]KAF2329011.1 hypothetical protein FND99_16915 [Flavobacterium daemonense]
MKKNVTFKKRGFNAVLMLSLVLAGFSAHAQQTTGDVAKQAGAKMGDIGDGSTTKQGGAIRVIDNKGTIKYLQVQNGITQITNTAPNGGIVTTWQLGGKLTDNTYIDATNKVFALDGIKLITAADLASTDATTGTAHGTGTGFTLLVRDEATGETKKMLATDLMTSGQTVFTATTGQTAFDVTSGTPAISGVQIPLPTFSKVWVYRNGAKLLAGVDYNISGSTVTIVPNSTEPEDFQIFAGDKIEVQYVK